jgi:hypothetical protein
MSTIQSSTEHLTLNADGAGKEIKFQANGTQVASITSAGAFQLTNWTITETAGVLYFATGGVNKAKLDASGNLTVVGDVTAFGTI